MKFAAAFLIVQIENASKAQNSCKLSR